MNILSDNIKLTKGRTVVKSGLLFFSFVVRIIKSFFSLTNKNFNIFSFGLETHWRVRTAY